MDIELKQRVTCESGDCRATVSHIVYDPVTERLAAVVVREDDPPNLEVVVPVDRLESRTPGQITLHGTRRELESFPPFDKTQFVLPTGSDTSYSGYLIMPYVLSKILMQVREITCRPLDQVPVRRGALVQATDGPAGRIAEFLIDAVNCELTHLVMDPHEQGGRRRVSIPLDAIEHMDRESVRVKFTRAGLRSLPRLPLWSPSMPEPECGAAEGAPIDLPQPELIRKLTAALTSRSGQKRMEARHRLVCMGTPVIEHLMPMLEHKKARVRWEAAKTLAQIGNPACIPGLLNAMDDHFFDIRWVASEALAGFGQQALEPLLQELVANPYSAVFRDSAHHVLRSILQSAPRIGLRDEQLSVLRSVMFSLEELHPISSLPRVSQQALELLRSYAGRAESMQPEYKAAYR